MTQTTKTVRVEEDHLGDETVSTKTEETPSQYDARHATNRGIEIVYYIAGVLSLLLGLRFVLILLGANNTGIINLVYQVTQPFVTPFYGIFGNTVIYGNARVEWESLLAVVAVAIIAYIVAGFLRLLK